MRLTVTHATTYNYGVPASYALLQLRQTPQTSQSQKILHWEMTLDGAQPQVTFPDQNGNRVDLIEILPGVSAVTIKVEGEVETYTENGVAGPHTLALPLWFYLRQTALTAPGPGITALIASLSAPSKDGVSSLHELSQAILEAAPYMTGTTGVETTAEDALQRANGVCQDHTHIFLGAARKLGFPARYVSGYLMMNDRIDQDASHAWAEAYVDGLGWVGFDVSNAICPDRRYVQVARGLDYREAAPMSGITVGAQEENLVVSIQVQQ